MVTVCPDQAGSLASLRWWLPVAGALALALPGCDGSTAPDAPVAQVMLTPSPVLLEPGMQVRVEAIVRDASGNALSGRTVAWSVSDSLVASVSTSGMVSSIAPGQAVLHAEVENVRGSAPISVTESRTPTAITTNLPAEPTSRRATFTAGRTGSNLWGGTSSSFWVEVVDASGVPIPGMPVIFRTDPTYLTISDSIRTTSSTGRVEFPEMAAPGPATPHLSSPTVFHWQGFTGRLEVVVPGVPEPLILEYRVLPGAITRLERGREDLGEYLAGQFAPRLPVARAFDAFGNRVQGGIGWRVRGGVGQVTPDGDWDRPLRWMLGDGENVLEAYSTANSSLSPVRFTARGVPELSSVVPVEVTIAFETPNRDSWERAVRNAIVRFTQYLDGPLPPTDVNVPAGSYGPSGMDVAFKPAIVRSGFTGVHVVVVRNPSVATAAAGAFRRRADGSPTVGIISYNPSALQALDAQLTSGETPALGPGVLVHEMGHVFGLVGVSPQAAALVTGTGQDLWFVGPEAWAYWKTIASPEWSFRGVPVAVGGHWMMEPIRDSMAAVGSGGISLLSILALRDAGLNIGLEAGEEPRLLPRDIQLAPGARSP